MTGALGSCRDPQELYDAEQSAYANQPPGETFTEWMSRTKVPFETWYEWSRGRDVHVTGKCDKWEKEADGV